MPFRAVLLCAAPLLLSCRAHAQPVNVIAKPTSSVERRYLTFLEQQLDLRGVQHRPVSDQPSREAGSLVVGTREQMRSLLTPEQYTAWRSAPKPKGEEGFAVTPVPPRTGRSGRVWVLCGGSQRGELFALGWLLRTATARQGSLHLPEVAPFASSPEKPVRGYQIGYRMKNNTYDAWTLAQFQQQMLDLAMFGLNTMQVVAPVSDDDPTSPLFPASAESTVIGLSKMSQDYDLRYDLFYPEMAQDYTDPKQAAAELLQFENLVRKLPRLDSIHVPGGDPGHTAPEVLLPLLEQEARILHKYHPAAKVWLSAQGFNAERYQRFYQMMRSAPYIDGVFFGPQSRESMEQQRRRLPAAVPLEFYPDTAHTMHSQFPVPQWDPVFQLVESREPICPRPAAFQHIYRHFKNLNSGFIVYSEGVNDDVNKVLWGGWGWNSNRVSEEILQDYARYFFQADDGEARAIADSIVDLEKNWVGPILQNTRLENTLSKLRMLHAPLTANSWRWDSLLYRAAYDRFLQLKRGREFQEERRVMAMLADTSTSADQRIRSAREALEERAPGKEEAQLHEEIQHLAGLLFHECGLQLSVKLYGASNWERGANLDRLDTPLNDRAWLKKELDEVSVTPVSEQPSRLHAIAHWTDPTAAAVYDDLGDPAAEPHLVRGAGWLADPELYHTAIDGIADVTLEKGWRFSWLTYAETLYEQPLTLHYNHIDPALHYSVRITYAGEEYKLPMELRANGTVVQDFRLRATNPETVEYPLPGAVTQKGELTLEWRRPFGAGGGGRGGQVAEVWLLPHSQQEGAPAIP